MKSLSDYTKILRDVATNLNLHGESVEMIVQMLANALYISEVEHITYSQEASLERATQENSKIQHCVNQMYSVYRGANPRVILNFTASKLFNFNPYDEILKSNNFKAYYLGYYDSIDGEIKYSACSIYPDCPATIICLMASEIYTSEWTVSDNLYYENHPISNLSSDLYMYVKDEVKGDELVPVTRIFSDHIRNNSFFDLTLPGYGTRIYYPEIFYATEENRKNQVNGIARDHLTNQTFQINVYKYLKLSSIVESELKAVKLSGAVLNEFGMGLLNDLGVKETYPGLVYIPETDRDGVDTIHHKANRSRYTGTYLSTNSDLSYLLQEYFPSKIRSNGVTHIFENLPSSTKETISRTYEINDVSEGTLIQYSELAKILRPSSGGIQWTNELGFLPPGKLTFSYRKDGVDEAKNSSYDLICSASILPATVSGDEVTPTLEYVSVKVLKNCGGVTSLLLTKEELEEEGLQVVYQYSSDPTYSETDDELRVPVRIEKTSNYRLEIYILREGVTVDKESIPAVLTPIVHSITTVETQKNVETGLETVTSTNTVETNVGSYYSFNLDDDNLYIQTDLDGNFSEPVSTYANMYWNGEKVGCTYSIIPTSDIEATVDRSTGLITITRMEESKKVAYITVQAEYSGIKMTEILTVKKSVFNMDDADGPQGFKIYGCVDGEPEKDMPIVSLVASGEEKKAEIEIPENTWDCLKIYYDNPDKKDRILFWDGEDCEMHYSYSYDVINRTYDPKEDGLGLIPSLYLFYIPYTQSNLLTETEISSFVSLHKSYYITHNISIQQGLQYTARFNITVELYTNTNLDEMVSEILNKYSYRFNQDLGTKNDQTAIYQEIKSLITKISDIKFVSDMEVVYRDSSGEEVGYEEKIKPNLYKTYFVVEFNIFSTVTPSNYL